MQIERDFLKTLIRCPLQADKGEEGGHPRNMLDAMRRAVDEGGFKGLYKGMNVSLVALERFYMMHLRLFIVSG